MPQRSVVSRYRTTGPGAEVLRDGGVAAFAFSALDLCQFDGREAHHRGVAGFGTAVPTRVRAEEIQDLHRDFRDRHIFRLDCHAPNIPHTREKCKAALP